MNEEEIFHQVLARSPDERAAYLEQVCAGEPALRAAVEALLRANVGASGFLEQPPTALVATVDEPIREGPGAVIGPYKLLEQIGEGGFGVVFLAEQTQPVRRKVALKVLKPGMDTRQVVARFEAERQALAIMDHPNIAKVLDGGQTASGRPYFVMELVKGTPITEFCDQNQQTPRQRLELFGSVCQAVQHAHQKGIIHRDLKPSNVLVSRHDTTPIVKVIDFGVAKALGQELTDKTLFTGIAQMIGTPLYMSPEQAGMSDLDIDTRSDIYSLGVLLYELLTGTTPFDQERLKDASYDELRRIIREEEPPRPSTRISTLGLAATTVSTQRQSDPKRLSQLLRGELDWIVMKALEKDRDRRYESASAFAADVQRYLADEPVAACPPSAWYRVRKFARRHRGRLTTAAVLTAALAALTGSAGWVIRERYARWAATSEQVNLALNEAAMLQRQQKWSDALAAVKRAESLLANGRGDAELHHRAQELNHDFEMAARLDDLRIQKTHYDDTGFWVGRGPASSAYAGAFQDYGIDVLDTSPEQVADAIQARSIREQLLAALDDWILVQADTDVRERLRDIAALADPDVRRNRMRQAVVANDRRALEELAARPEVASLPLATAHLLGQALANAGAGQQAVQVLAAVQQRHPQDFWLNYTLGVYLLWGPGVQHNHQDAAAYLRAALVARPDYATVYVYLGIALVARKHWDEIIALNRKAIELVPNYVDAHVNLGSALREQGKLSEAESEFREALRLRPDEPEAHKNLGNILIRQGKHAEAEAEHREAVRLRPGDAASHNNLGVVLSLQGKQAEAVAEFREALRLRPDYSEAHANLGCRLWDQGKQAEAESEFREALRLRPDNPEAHFNLGSALGDQGKEAEAESEFREALRLRPNYAEAHGGLGLLLQRRGRFAEALNALRRSHQLGSQRPRWSYPSEEWVRRAEQLDALDAKLSRVLQGPAQPADAAEMLALAKLCQDYKKHYAAATRLYAEAFAAEPKLADDLSTVHRYNAACAAALAGCGQGEDAAPLDDAARARLRRQALDWLLADLAARRQLLAKEPAKSRAAVQQTLRHWQQDTDFAGVRGDALAKLSEAERPAWRQLWEDVEQTLEKAGRGDAGDKK
jgi:serine/threonine protein kinase/Flp pilus assembly protein TadD